ncbi:MAG: hypothetical protein WBM56_13095 [Robiginitalea sp.]|uniref:hypothetical protein n=1 Tax=Robiginitalea sp. TaxID=1902411 RepID=UPI003C772F6E
MSGTREIGAEGTGEGLQVLSKAQASGLLPSLMLQLQKDYGRAGLEFPIPQEHIRAAEPTEIFSSLKEGVYLLLMEHFDQYLNLMYAVDLPERYFQGIDPRDAVEAAHQLSGLILKREWQKIQWRRSYPGSDSAQK